MACCARTEDDKRDRDINKMLKSHRKEQSAKIKLLLLGAGESGKSTFFKQMKIINMDGYKGEKEREEYKKIVYANTVGNMVSLLEATETLKVTLLPENKEPRQKIYSLDASPQDMENGISDVVEDLKKLWKDPGILDCFARAAEFQLNDSAEYFFNNLDRIAAKDYIPTVEDILRIRVKTSGITEIEFTVEREKFVVVDVGGQRSERRKWIHCFDSVTAIIFFAALPEYDQKLSEDATTNRMSESLKLFRDIANYKLFIDREIAIILFLNKMDIFEKKIKKIPLTVYFKEYTGPDDPAIASDYIRKKFVDLAPQNKQIYVHKTCATDTNGIRVVFKAVKDIIVSTYLRNMGLLDYNVIQEAPKKNSQNVM